MIDILALKAEMVRNGYTQGKLAEKLEISSKTLSSRFKKGVFSSDEIESMVSILKIANPMQIFFSDWVTSEDTFRKES